MTPSTPSHGSQARALLEQDLPLAGELGHGPRDPSETVPGTTTAACTIPIPAADAPSSVKP